MSSLAWLVIIFFVLCFLVLFVYVLVVRAYYWGDKKQPQKKNRAMRKLNKEKTVEHLPADDDFINQNNNLVRNSGD